MRLPKFQVSISLLEWFWMVDFQGKNDGHFDDLLPKAILFSPKSSPLKSHDFFYFREGN